MSKHFATLRFKIIETNIPDQVMSKQLEKERQEKKWQRFMVNIFLTCNSVFYKVQSIIRVLTVISVLGSISHFSPDEGFFYKMQFVVALNRVYTCPCN